MVGIRHIDVRIVARRVAAVGLAWPDQRPERPTTGGTGTSTVTTLELLHRDQVAFQVPEDLPAIRARSEQLPPGAFLPAGEPPVEAHPHPHAAEDEELLASVVGVAHLISQLEQLESIWAIEYPDSGGWDGLQDLAAPLVDQVRRRDDQGPAIAGRVHDRCSDGHHGFPGAHLGVDDSGLLVTVQQQGGDGLDDLGLGREGLRLSRSITNWR